MNKHRLVKGPRKAGVTDYARLSESLSKCSRTGRFRRDAEIIADTSLDEVGVKIELFKTFKQSAVSGVLRLRVESPYKLYRDDGVVLISETRRRFEVEDFRDDGKDKRLPRSRGALVCKCKGSKRVNRDCPIHRQQVSFIRLVCQCGTSFVPGERFQDCCRVCWGAGKTPNARVFGMDKAGLGE